MSVHNGTFQIGHVVNDKYEIIAVIGRGAYGTVYKAIQHPVGRTVAIKVISRHLSADPDNRVRFFHEAKALARLNNSAVVTLYDYGDSDGQLFIAMEYIEGEELAQIISREAPIEPCRVIQLSKQILHALVEAHEIGLVHRDLKPANVMVYRSGTGEERIKILDLGLALLRDERLGAPSTDQGRSMGTPEYSSPEQLLGQPIGPASDLYSLGIILFEMLAGHRPFNEHSPWMLMQRHLNSNVPSFDSRLDIPAGLESAVRLAMAKRPEARFPDARAMLTRLLELDESVSAVASFNMPTLRDLDVINGQNLAELAQKIEQRSRTEEMPTSHLLVLMEADTSDENTIGTADRCCDDEQQLYGIGYDQTLDMSDQSSYDSALPEKVPPWGSCLKSTLAINTVMVISVGFMLTVFSNYS